MFNHFKETLSDPAGVPMLRLDLPSMSPTGPMLYLFDADAAKIMYQNEGKYPYRGHSFHVRIT